VRIIQYLKWMRRRDGGVVNTCSLLCPMLARQGHEVLLLTCEDDDLDPGEWAKIDYSRSPAPPDWTPAFEPGKPLCVRIPLRDPLAALRGRSAHDSEKDEFTQLLPGAAIRTARLALANADVLHLHGMWPSSNLQLARLARSLRVPYVVSPHGMIDDWCMEQGGAKKRLFMRLFGTPLLNRARCVHFEGSEEMRQGRKFTSAPVTIGPPPPIDHRPFLGQPTPDLARATFPHLARDAFHILDIGRITPKKGPDKLLHALAHWRRLGLNVHAAFAGKGHPPEFERQMHDLARSLSVDDACTFLGQVGGEAKWSLFAASNLVVLPTSQENFGIVLVEAMACGTPVLTTKAVDIWPELEASGGAVIIDGGPGITDQLVRTLPPLMTDRERLHAMGKSGQRWALAYEEPAAVAHWYARMLRGECDTSGAGATLGPDG
jgi:glycosyltransferase involved in cell wall biosynthesis